MVMRSILVYVFILSWFFAPAQTTLPSGKIEVVKDFEVRLAESQKIRIVPQPVQIDSAVRKYDYKLQAPSPAIEYEVPELKPLAIQSEKRPQYYPLFAKAGYGNPNSFVGQFSYDNVKQENFQWGVDLRHLSANNKKIPLQQFSTTQGRVNAAYKVSDHSWFKGYVDSKLETVYFYGADPIPSNEESLKRKYTRQQVGFSFGQEYSPETSLNYHAFIQILNDKDDLGSRERGLKAGGDINTRFSGDRYPVGVKVLADLSSLTHNETYAVNNILLSPYAGYSVGSLTAHLGGILLLSNIENEFLPDIQLTYPLGSGGVKIIAGWEGRVAKNNFRFLSTYNPYISTRLDSLNNEVSRSLYAGFQGGTGNTVYEFKCNYTRFTGMALFLQDEDIPEQFVPLYDDGAYFGIEGMLRMEVLKSVFVRAQVFHRFFSLEDESKPWHRPSFGLNGELSYAGDGDVFHVAFAVNAENGLPYLTLGGTESTLDPMIDLNLHGDYYVTPAIGVFGELNNLLSNKRERWVNYPSFGFNAKVGVLFRLP